MFIVHNNYTSEMENAGLLLDALVASPVRTLERLEQHCHHSCQVVGMDVSSAIGALRLARESGVRRCHTLVNTTAKFVAAVREGFRNAAAGLDAVASLCASAMAFHDAGAAKAALAEARRERQLVSDLQAATDVRSHYWAVDVHDAGVLEHHFKQCVDVPIFHDCQFVCEVDKGKVFLAAGTHSLCT